MTDRRTHQQISLNDGRLLGYTEFGAPEGVPVFYFHGFSSARLDYLVSDPLDAASKLEVRIIAPDRPGIGLSGPQRRRSLLDWPGDVVQLAAALGIDRFAVLGISGGGPYALACAFKIPERLAAAATVCGMGPAKAPGMVDSVSWTLPGQPAIMRRLVLSLTAMGLRKDPDQFLTRSKEMMAKVDGRLLDDAEVARLFLDGMQEAFRQGIAGVHHDAAIYTRPWGFDLEDVSARVHLWQGGLDKNVPLSTGRHMAQAIPNCDARFLEQEGHLTLPHHHIGEILGALL